MVTNDSSVWNKIKSWFSVSKIIILSVLGFLLLVTTVILNVSGVWDKFFPDEDIIFKTIYIDPDPKNDTYPLCILSGGEIVPITSPLPDEDAPTEMFGGLRNIKFTLTNNTQSELLVDKIEATLIQYENIPEKCIYASGPMAILVPIDLLLVLSPEQSEYDLSREKYFAISSGKTEHIFQVYVAGTEPGVYRFKIKLRCRIGGEIEQLVESDTTYSFIVPDLSTCAKCLFLYKSDQSDPNFQELTSIVNKPLDEFKQITSSWGEYKLLDCIHNAPTGLRDFIGVYIPSTEDSTSTQVPTGLITKDASELALSVDDLTSKLASMKKPDGSPVEVALSKEDLPDWILSTQRPDDTDGALSAYSVKYSMHSPSIEVLYNTVIVYPTVELAHQAYLDVQPPDRKLFRIADAQIGDEYYMAIGTSTRDKMKILVFRKKNIVAALVGMPDSIFIESYARIIESKI